MQNRNRKIMINKAGGTAGKDSVNYRISLPAPWMQEMGIDEDDRDVSISFVDNKIIISKEGLTMLDFGEFKLKEVEGSETFYIATLDTNIIVTKNKRDLSQYKKAGKLKVYHDGNYFGTPEEMDEWLQEKVIDHLVEEGYLIEDRKTVMGEILWKLA